MRLRFVTSPHGNYHMTELLAGLSAVCRAAGHDAELVSSEFPDVSEGTVYVFIPHEFYGCEPSSAWPSHEQRERTIALCVENPGTSWFELVCELAPQFARIVAINRSSLAELRRRGVAAEHLQLGYLPDWDRWRGEEHPRPIDVTYLGSADRRRDALVAGYGRWFSRRRTAMLVPGNDPKPSLRPDYLVGDEKYAHLSRSKVLVNLHREGTSSFEWARALQAIANGCVVVSEPSADDVPLIAGHHFIVAAAESIPHLVNGLLSEPARLEAIRRAAYEMVRRELDMAPAVERLVAVAQELLVHGPTHIIPATGPPPRPLPVPAQPAPPDDVTRLCVAVRNLSTETIELRRSMQRLLERSEGRDPDDPPEYVAFTPSFRDARPRVSVVIALHNYEREVLDALASVAASEFDNYEVLVLDDASPDGSLRAAREFLRGHPWMPAALMRHRVNRGLGASRNALLRQARGEHMFVLDADNTIYPMALGRLLEALDHDPGATFAYPLMAVTRSEQPIGLLSRYAWDPDGFQAGNYIDAMAMIRVDDLSALGGYTEDPRLTGWEDFHLWCACVESGRRGTLVPEVLARYRELGHSMLRWTQTDTAVASSLMHARFPEIVAPA